VSPALRSVQLFLLAGVAFLALGSLASAALARAVAPRLGRCEPRLRHRALALLALAPMLFALGLLFSASLPSLVGLVAPALDHCTAHDDGHAHLCFVHLPQAGVGAAFGVALVVAFGYVGARAALSAAGLLRATRALRALEQTGLRRPDLDVIVVDTSHPVCFAAGLLSPRVLLSRGLLDSLGDDDRAIVLAHERAHVRRRDALVASIVHACATAHVPGVRRWLVRELAIAAEQACDEEAGALVGDRVAVASAILAVERAAQHAASRDLGPLAVAFGEHAVERRVESLLAEPTPPASLRPLYVGLALAALALLVGAGELHHITESFLSALAR
jgi:beta-lactamase regulating signal transducer with metallopeptidase domain